MYIDYMNNNSQVSMNNYFIEKFLFLILAQKNAYQYLGFEHYIYTYLGIIWKWCIALFFNETSKHSSYFKVN